MEDLIEAVIRQIQEDVDNCDMTAIEELLTNVPRAHLVGFLPEEKWKDFG